MDYDNIPAADTADFQPSPCNACACRAPRKWRIAEIFHKLSVLPKRSPCYLPQVIRDSQLIELKGEMPAQRPDRTLDAASGLATAYVNSNCDGDDGAPLTDYDVIGRSGDRTGLFALASADFNFLCIPPLSRDQDVGPIALLVGARICKERRALLIVDPPAAWNTADDALRGMRDWNFADENSVMYFPRVLAHDKLRGHFRVILLRSGSVAGILARGDEASGVWAPHKSDAARGRSASRIPAGMPRDRRSPHAARGPRSQHPVGRTVGLCASA